MSQTIRAGIDFSPRSALALDHAAAIAGRLGRPLEIVHADETLGAARLFGQRHPEELVAFLQDSEREARAELEALRDHYVAAGLDARALIVSSTAVEALCRPDPLGDLVVVGATGRSGLDRFLIGSTAIKVVRSSRDPVLVARCGRTRYQRILVATDFEEAAERAIELAIELAEPEATIDVLHVWRLPPVFTGYLAAAYHAELMEKLAEDTNDAAIARARPLLERFADRDLELITTQGEAAASILDRSAGYDLIAVGSRGRQGFGRIVRGSVAERVAAHAGCSVLIAH
jgi:nucleotide-binding universal stress UspA family protein